MSTNDDNTLGFTLELYSRYMDAAKVCEMFLKNLSIIFQGVELGGGGRVGEGDKHFFLWGGLGQKAWSCCE